MRMLALAILEARSLYRNSTIADLYDLDVMPDELWKTDRDLDSPVDKEKCDRDESRKAGGQACDFAILKRWLRDH